MLNFEEDIIRDEFNDAMKSGVASEENNDKLSKLIKRRSEIDKRKQK